MAITLSTYIPTGASALTRNVDALSFSFNARPQAMTVYVRLVVLNPLSGAATGVLVQVGSLTTAGPRLLIDQFGQYRAIWLSASGVSVSSTVGSVSPVVGDIMELRAVLTATGTIQLGVSRNGAAEVLGALSAAQVLPQAWNSANLKVNDSSGVTNSAAYTHILILAGVQPLATMQRRAGVI